MRPKRFGRLGLIGLLAGMVTSVAPSAPAARAATAGADPATWPDQRLAAQLVLAGASMSNLSPALTWARHGIGGIVLFGTPQRGLASRLAAIRAAEPVPPFVASDEEGGEVQRLAPLIYPLPSAQWMGAHRRPVRVRQMATAYAARMRALGVDMDLAPDSDLLVPGYFIAEQHRAFSADPTTDGRFVDAWQAGMRAAHVVPVVKHWPGHGHANDTHASLSTTPPLSYLRTHDLLPFRAAFAQHAPVVMVGHLVVPGLTETSRTPASLSRRALHYLRSMAGPAAVIVTDSLEMGAIRRSVGLTQPQAAVRALQRGADMALVQDIDADKVVAAVAHALSTGGYARSAAVASARRILAAKRISTPPRVPTMRLPSDGATGVAVTGPLSALLTDRLGGIDAAYFSVRAHGSPTWNVVPGARVSAAAGTRASYGVPDGRLVAGRAYDWRVRACNAAGTCSAWSTVRTFTTATATTSTSTSTSTST